MTGEHTIGYGIPRDKKLFEVHFLEFHQGIPNAEFSDDREDHFQCVTGELFESIEEASKAFDIRSKDIATSYNKSGLPNYSVRFKKTGHFIL